MSNAFNPINVILLLGTLATFVGVITIVTGDDNATEVVAVAPETAAPVEAPKDQTDAGVWGGDEAEEGGSDPDDPSNDEGGWGDDGDRPLFVPPEDDDGGSRADSVMPAETAKDAGEIM